MHTEMTLRRLSFLACFLGVLGMALPVVAGGLPDTGQSLCYNTSTTTDCVSDSSYPRQDGGVSSTLSYTKIDSSGNEMDVSASGWACARDNHTSLLWEVKTADLGLRDGTHRYVWFIENNLTNGGNEGGGDVPASACGAALSDGCSTTSYIERINNLGLCGASDWRLPTQMELLTLVHSGNVRPTIDTNFFPNTASLPYWSSTTYAVNPLNAWGVHFGYGATHAVPKSEANAVRLVRGVWGQQP
jgi:hypothetical protein